MKSLEITDLTIGREQGASVIERFSLRLSPGESCGLIGESGSGKTSIGLAILRLLPAGLRQAAGCIRWAGRDLSDCDEAGLNQVRGAQIAMVFQDPHASFIPVLPVGAQGRAILRKKRGLTRALASQLLLERFAEVGLDDPQKVANSFPHELSGGMRQRALIAFALLNDPQLLIADEPTTALDAHLRTEILALLKRLQQTRKLSLLLISHDHTAVAALCSRSVLLRAGRVVEESPDGQWHSDYAQRLLACRPRQMDSRARLPTLNDLNPTPRAARKAPGGTLLSVRELGVVHPRRGWFGRAPVAGLNKLSLDVAVGEIVGVVGPSGCGKTTLGRALAGLQPLSSGTIAWSKPAANALERARRVQMVFQNPYASLNPAFSVGVAFEQVLRLHAPDLGRDAAREEAVRLLETVGLKAEHLNRRPAQFSGGERQRLAIARALSVKPDLLICDECTSALDVSVQAQLLNLLKDLQAERNLSLVFISHDLDVVNFLSDRVLELKAHSI